MYHLMGKEDCLNTFVYLSKIYNKSDIKSFEDLKSRMFEFLSKVQSEVPRDNSKKFITNNKNVEKLISFFKEESTLTDMKSKFEEITPVESMKNALDFVGKSLKSLKKVDEDLYYIFDLAITNIFYARSKTQGGGSVSGAVGVIWCSHRKNWSIDDVLELLVHELTHNLIFIDELKYGHYQDIDKMTEKENYALSSILNQHRPLDKAFHSLIVAVELLEYRKRNTNKEYESIVHPSSQIIYNSINKTVKSIEEVTRNNPEIVTQRFNQILREVKKWIQNY